ncbi:MAG: type II toxin-antitoxin system RelE/ParE family toxin [Proteobacteria bacterium]|nr:type II toxin-antitoxin system RelE/ParE family toxin [Pseudomonadota bacterium]
MPEYRLTPAAKSDLIEIWNHTVDTWGEKQAEKYLQDMENKLNQLAETPEIGQIPLIRGVFFNKPMSNRKSWGIFES